MLSDCFFQVLLCMVTALYFGCYKFMESMAKPTYSDSGALIDGGMDLNTESGTAEYVLKHFYGASSKLHPQGIMHN